MRFRKFLKPYRTRGSSFREHTVNMRGGFLMKSRQQLMIFIEKQKTAFIASVDEEGFPTVKAMFAPRKIEGDSFYFSTNTSSKVL